MNKSEALGLVGSLFGRQTAQRFATEGVNALPTIEKDAANIRNTPKDIGAYQDENNQYYTNLLKLHAAENEFMVQLGGFLMGPGIEAMQTLTTALHDITDWAKANPDLAKKLSEIAIGFGLVSGALGALYLGLLPFIAWGRLMISGGEAIASLTTKIPALSGDLVELAGAFTKLAGPIAYLYGVLHPSSTQSPADDRQPYGGRSLHERFPNLIVPNTTPEGVVPGSDPRASPYGGVATPPPRINLQVQLNGDVNLDGRKVGSLVAGAIADQSQRANQSIGGLNLRLNPFPAEQGGAW